MVLVFSPFRGVSSGSVHACPARAVRTTRNRRTESLSEVAEFTPEAVAEVASPR